MEGHIYAYTVPVGRVLLGLVAGTILGVVGSGIAASFNLMIGFPWPLAVHQNIQVVGIGLGAGTGAYLGWMNLDLSWYWILGSLLLVLLGGIAGTYVGYVYGPDVGPSFWGRGFAVDITVHLAGVMGGITVSTILGLIYALRASARLRPQPKAVRDLPGGTAGT